MLRMIIKGIFKEHKILKRKKMKLALQLVGHRRANERLETRKRASSCLTTKPKARIALNYKKQAFILQSLSWPLSADVS